MKYIIYLLPIFIFANDFDFDGVDDSIDKCPNTPFDELVNKDGCTQSYASSAKYIFQVGLTQNLSQHDTDTNLYFAYIYKPWEFSISTTSYTMNLTNNVDVNDDIYLRLGYYKSFQNLKTKISFGSRVLSQDGFKIDRLSNYLVSFDISYDLSNYSLFGYYSYNFGNGIDSYQNLSVGGGKNLTSKLYSSLSYGYFDSTNQNLSSVTLYNSYMISDIFYASLSYTHNFDYDYNQNSISFNLGVCVE